MAFLRTKPLEDEIRALREKIDAEIDKHVAEVARKSPGVPPGNIRQTLASGLLGLNCQCAAYLEIKNKEAKKEAA